MKTLRYLLIVVGLVSVLSVSAQTPQYGNTYRPQERLYLSTGTHVMAEQPQAEMYSTSSMPSSGSTLPQAAVDGVSTADGSSAGGNVSPNRRRIGGGNSGGGNGPTNPDDPFATPLGDAAIPLMLLALAYAVYKVRRRART